MPFSRGIFMAIHSVRALLKLHILDLKNFDDM